MALGDAVSTLQSSVWILNHASRSITWFFGYHKSMKLGKMANLNAIFFVWWCQFIDQLKFETRLCSLRNFGNAYQKKKRNKLSRMRSTNWKSSFISNEVYEGIKHRIE